MRICIVVLFAVLSLLPTAASASDWVEDQNDRDMQAQPEQPEPQPTTPETSNDEYHGPSTRRIEKPVRFFRRFRAVHQCMPMVDSFGRGLRTAGKAVLAAPVAAVGAAGSALTSPDMQAQVPALLDDYTNNVMMPNAARGLGTTGAALMYGDPEMIPDVNYGVASPYQPIPYQPMPRRFDPSMVGDPMSPYFMPAGGGYGYGSSMHDVTVRGHWQNGTYVRPYHRTAGDGTQLNNYSTLGNRNYWTGQTGRRRASH